MEQLSRSSEGSTAPHPPSATFYPTMDYEFLTVALITPCPSRISRFSTLRIGVVYCFKTQLVVRSSAKCGVHSTGAGAGLCPKPTVPLKTSCITLLDPWSFHTDLHCR